MEKTGIGYIRIRVFTANGALPVKGALVSVMLDEDSGESGQLLAELSTDVSGLTPTVAVPTPPRSLTMSPNSSVRPYSTVNVQVVSPGYYTVENVGIPVFDGSLSRQDVNMLPRSDGGGYPDEGIIINENTGEGEVYSERGKLGGED